jgi:hypothetical protein
MTLGVVFHYLTLRGDFIRRTWIAGIFLVGGFMLSFADFARFATSVDELKERAKDMGSFTSVDGFYDGNLDAFELLTYGTRYVEEWGIEPGRQLTAVMLFWIPRNLWPNKALPTGELLGSSFIDIMHPTENTNLSAPIVLEGYINFGVFGVIAFGVISGLVAGALDGALRERRIIGSLPIVSEVYLIDAIAAPLLGLWMFIFRGALLAAFAYSSGIVFSSVLAWALFLRAKKHGHSLYARGIQRDGRLSINSR